MRSARLRNVLLIACACLCVCVLVALLLFRPADDVSGYDAVRSSWRASHAELLDRHGEIIDRVRMDFRVRRMQWIALDEVSPALTEAIVLGEDRRFWSHGGVDWIGMAGAVRDGLLGRRWRGASTITMQVARLINPSRRLGKLEQIRVARGLERRWSKRQLLEAYLNLLDFRGELQGIDAAARVLAGKTPGGLNLSESLVLAALLPAPAASADRVAARACARAAARSLELDCDQLKTTAAELLAKAGQPNLADPDLAPHVARMLLARAGERIQTTLDARLQRMARETLERHLSDLKGRNVRDGAVLIADTATGEVLAYVGSAGPYSTSREVDGVQARRQAGSTLKPFLYALALERRYLTAASLLDDSQIALESAGGLYLPQNYDRDFKGLVSVRTALASSLNVPAVRALTLVGVEPFRERLFRLGYEDITEDGEFYGYSLALGSAEVSLWQQVQAYRTLARGGRLSPLTLRPDRSMHETSDHPVIEKAAAFVIADILSDRAARVPTFGLANHLNTPFWSAVKTGTSKDMRDNWCIGFTSRYVVGVWVGNFEGDSMHDVSGVTGAAPVWNELITALHANTPPESPQPPDGATRTKIAFTPPVEPSRQEWFLDGTETRTIGTLSAESRISRILNPANGMIIAIDPDIPPTHQRVPFTARNAGNDLLFRLNGQTLGPATGQFLWQPRPGTHQLELVDPDGRIEDKVSFVVR